MKITCSYISLLLEPSEEDSQPMLLSSLRWRNNISQPGGTLRGHTAALVTQHDLVVYKVHATQQQTTTTTKTPAKKVS